MLKKVIVSVICLSLILSTFAFAAPPTKAGSQKTISAQTGPLAQFGGQMVDLGGGKVAIAYFSNRYTSSSTGFINFGDSVAVTYDLLVRIVNKYGQTQVNDVKITTGTLKPKWVDVLDPLANSIKSNSTQLIADGQGGVIVTYSITDTEKNTKAQWVQRMSGSGTLMWGIQGGVAAGVQLSATDYSNPRIVTDGAGGCYASCLVTMPDLMGGPTKYYGQLTHLDSTGSVGGVPDSYIPAGDNTNQIYDFEIASVPKDINAPTGNVYMAWSIKNVNTEVQIAVKDSNQTYVWGDPVNDPKIALTQDNNYYKDIALAGDANNMFIASNQYDGFDTLSAVNVQRTDYLLGNLTWNNDLETWGQSIALSSPSFTTIADCPVLLTDGSDGVYAAYWDFDGDSTKNQLKLSGINSDKSAKTIVNLQRLSNSYAGMAKLVADNDGGVTAFWADGRNTGSSGSTKLDIYAQRVKGGAAQFSANGLNLTADIGNKKLLPSAAFMDDRYFMIYSGTNAFDTIYTTANHYGIYCNSFPVDGTLTDPKSWALIDDLGAVSNTLPNGVRRADGRTLIAWTDSRNGYPQVFANILDINGNKTIADIAFQKTTLDLAAWPYTALTPDGRYVWVVYSGVPFDPNILSVASPGILSPRPLNALQAQLQAKKVQAKAESILPRFYANKIDLSTGIKVFANDIRVGSGYYGIEALPAVAATKTGGVAVAYGTLTGMMGGADVVNQGVKAQKAQPSYGILPRAGISVKAPVSNYLLYVKVLNSDGSFITGQTANTKGFSVVDETAMAQGFSSWTDINPTMVNTGDDLLLVWSRKGAQIVPKAGQAPTVPYLLYCQKISLSDYSLSYPTGLQLTSPTPNPPAGDNEFHANADLSYRNGKFGLTWVNMIVNSGALPGYTKSRIDAMAGAITDDGVQLLWGPTAITEQKIAYYDEKVDPIWNAVLYPNIRFLNDRWESVVSWQEYNQVAAAAQINQGFSQGVRAKIEQKVLAASPTINAGSVYAMHMSASGAPKLTAPFEVIGLDKCVFLPVMIDNRNNCSLTFLTITANTGLTGATTFNFASLLQTVITVIFNNSTLVALQNVGFIEPLGVTGLSFAPASATSLNAVFNNPSDNTAEFHVYNAAGTLLGVFPVAGPYVISGLQPNTALYARVAAVNDAGLVYSDYTTGYTLAAAPHGATYSAATNTLSWATPEINASSTRFRVRLKKNDVVVMTYGGTFAEASTNTAIPFTGLEPNTIYEAEIGSYNINGDFNPEVARISFSRTLTGPSQDRPRLMVGDGQVGRLVRDNSWVGNNLIVRMRTASGSTLSSVQVIFTNKDTGQVTTWNSNLTGLTASATGDSDITVPVNISKGTYYMKTIAIDNNNLRSENTTIIRVDDRARVADGFIAAAHMPGGTGLQASQAGAADFATISYQLTKDPTQPVTLMITDVGGQMLMRRVIAPRLPGAQVGYNAVEFDGVTPFGPKISRGLHLLQIMVDGTLTTGAIVVH